MRSFLRRAGWLFLTLLFIVTGLGVGVVAFWQATHQNNSQTSPPPPPPPADKLAGTKLENFTPVAHIDSLQKIDTKEGNGAAAQPNSTVTVLYTGALASTGVIFESNADTGQPLTSQLSGLIKGWQDGIPGMKVGGTRRLLIPAAQAYGAQANEKIPANSDLVFDVTLLSVK